jgi:exodeoxyribonuclease-3
MKIVSWNVNGIRSAYNKGFQEWLDNYAPDILCLQEIKAQKDQFPEKLIANNLFESPIYNIFVNSASKPGYSGVAVLSKKIPLKIEEKLGNSRFDSEGRMIKLDFPDFTLFNFYLPHGGRLKENLAYKLEVYDLIISYLKKFSGQKIILAGDFNIAHQEIDLARPKDNINNTMYTREERNKIDKLLSLGFIDTFRIYNKNAGHYTWWRYGFDAKERNLGWRIDYFFASKEMGPKIKNAFILDDVSRSDHCPVGIEIAS